VAGLDGAVRIINRRAGTVIDAIVVLPIADDIFREPNVEPLALPEGLIILPIVI
jgi:hypothetical protein